MTNASDEYAIEPALFVRTLRAQRATRMKGGLYHQLQVLMAYNTNHIEGSSLDEDQTRYIYETRTVIGQDVPVDDVVETVNSFELFDALIDDLEAPITAETMKRYHAILKRGTADARRPSFAVGDFKRVANVVGGRATTAPEHVELAIAGLLSDIPQRGRMRFEDIAGFHQRFEAIHPFQDGNGRVGRALMFQQCLQNNIMPFVVLDSKKAFYYRGLAEWDETPGFLLDTFRSLQDDFYTRFASFVERALE